jgi:hypothetical protein
MPNCQASLSNSNSLPSALALSSISCSVCRMNALIGLSVRNTAKVSVQVSRALGRTVILKSLSTSGLHVVERRARDARDGARA